MSAFSTALPEQWQLYGFYAGALIVIIGLISIAAIEMSAFVAFHNKRRLVATTCGAALFVLFIAILGLSRGYWALPSSEDLYVNLYRAQIVQGQSSVRTSDDDILYGYELWLFPVYITNNRQGPATIDIEGELTTHNGEEIKLTAEKNTGFTNMFGVIHEKGIDPDTAPVVYSPITINPKETSYVQLCLRATVFYEPLDFRGARLVLTFTDASTGRVTQVPWKQGIPGRMQP